MLVIMMIGLQGSGKSTKAKELAIKHDAVVFSSDECRAKYPTASNENIFEMIYSGMVNVLCLEKRNVILDATNINLKDRRRFFSYIKSHKVPDLEVWAYVMNTPFYHCYVRVALRNQKENSHKVPLDVVEKYLKRFQMPILSEGFDKIILDRNVEEYQKSAIEYLCRIMAGFDQKSKHHTKDLLTHSLCVGRKINNEKLGLLHDVGKLMTQTIDENGEGHYYNHAEIGAYYLLSNPEFFENEAELINVVTYTNYHMLPFNWETEKSHNKWRNILGGDLYYGLIEFNMKDKESC